MSNESIQHLCLPVNNKKKTTQRWHKLINSPPKVQLLMAVVSASSLNPVVSN